jgi:hypothetical protein
MHTVYVCNMSNHHDWELIQLYQEEVRALREALRRASDEVRTLREDSALVVYALDCAVQLTDSLITWLPEGMVLPEGVKTCKYRLDEAMKAIGRRKP